MIAGNAANTANTDQQALAKAVQNVMDDAYLTATELGDRWGYSQSTIANQRCQMIGLPFTKLPGGKVMYRMSDVIAAELAGYTGAESPSVASAIESFPGLDPKTRKELVRHIKYHTTGK